MRAREISAAAALVSGSGKVATIYPIESYRKFYVREARAKIRASASSLKSSSSASSLSRLSEISLLSDGELLKTVSQLRGTEKKIEITMLLYLIEVERRGLDLAGGYNSLFAFCTKHLKYSDSVAGRRIRAARCMRDYPAVYEYLSAGKVNICNISEIAKIMTEKNHLSLLGQISGRSTSYVRVLVSSQQPATIIRDRVTPVKVFEKVYVKESGKANEKATGEESGDANSHSTESQGVLSGLENPGGGQKLITTGGDKKSCTLCESGEGASTPLLERGPLEGSIRVKEIQKFKLQFAVSPEFMTKYERIKELMSTRTPGGIDFEGAFEALMDEYIEKHSPEAREKRREARAAKKKVKSVAKIVKKKVKTDAKVERTKNEAPAARTVKAVKVKPAAKGPDQPLASSEPSRFIPQAIKDQVNKRDGGKCAFTGPGGQRCGSKWNIQVDHIIPFALGGSNKPDNLQLLCRRHNQHKAIKDFGKKKIHSHSKRK